jgi:hypothetical protein
MYTAAGFFLASPAATYEKDKTDQNYLVIMGLSAQLNRAVISDFRFNAEPSWERAYWHHAIRVYYRYRAAGWPEGLR